MTSQGMFELLFTELKTWCRSRAAADREGNEGEQFVTFAAITALVRYASNVFEAQPEQARDYGIGERELLDLFNYAADQLGHRHSACGLVGVFCLETADFIGGEQFKMALARKMDRSEEVSKN